MYSYHGITAKQINCFFPGCVPCRCHVKKRKQSNSPKYHVRLILGNQEIEQKGSIISGLVIECNCCGIEEFYDVGGYNIYEKDIDENW